MIHFRIMLVAASLIAFSAGLLVGVPATSAAQNPFISSEKSDAPPKRNPIMAERQQPDDQHREPF